MGRRTARRRVTSAILGVAGTGFILGVGGATVAARPNVESLPAQRGALGVPMLSRSATQGAGSGASISGDGRFVVYQAPPTSGDDPRASTVYLTDRESDTTTEITQVPPGVRTGDSIHPVLAGDGCSIVVVTQLPLDVFRDDDTGDRWDVYRQRLAHCGAASSGWELVSIGSDGSGLARDDVSTVDPPAVSRSGTLIAYTHPASHLIEPGDITSVSLVDLEQPIVSATRSRLIAGTPVSSPDTRYVHRGIDQPAISGNGRFVAFRSDAASTDAVAGWGFGQVDGGPATRQVFVWDRDELDPFAAVRLVSARPDGQPSRTGASEPALSRDGRVVVFTSDDIGLMPATFPPCGGACPSQVFRLDRDVDENLRFDEPGRTELSMVSSVPDTVPPVAGTGPSSQPAVTADGQLVAFITKAANLQVVKAAGGGEAADGDLLIADSHQHTLRRVTMQPDGIEPALGAHSRPDVSDTGRVTVFDTLVAGQLVAGAAPGRQIVAITTEPDLSLADGDFGSTLVGLTSEELFVAVINNGPTTFTPSSVTVSDSRFAVNLNTSTCALGVAVPPGGDCTVRFTFTPSALGPVTARLTVAEQGFQPVSVSAQVRGTGGEPMLFADPKGATLGDLVVGHPSDETMFDVRNIAVVSASVTSIRLVGADAGDFAITSDSCHGKRLNPQSSCSIGVTFTPTGPGRRTALALVTTSSGQYTSIVLGGDGRYDAAVMADRAVVDAGEQFVVGGNGFPANTQVSVFFDDDARHVVTVTTNEVGDFLVGVPVAEYERGGRRTVVAQAAGATLASTTIDVIEHSAPMVGVPGFGLG